ncbi:UNKNOWN [Stylonychia lemnae]|uniref:Homeobox domain-containing protein n=1 Tax=Stylonychia lemnae TaxID=5949 RepID=A0A078AI38_STYLE|nr:UNKNOWN [Stylonychia lemnae]|eukprot:CDW81915.1 UNKNOWN [Stylonychia lemnae]
MMYYIPVAPQYQQYTLPLFQAQVQQNNIFDRPKFPGTHQSKSNNISTTIIIPSPIYQQPKQQLITRNQSAMSGLNNSTMTSLSSFAGSAFTQLKKPHSTILFEGACNNQYQKWQEQNLPQLKKQENSLSSQNPSKCINLKETSDTLINLTILHQRALEKEKIEKLIDNINSSDQEKGQDSEVDISFDDNNFEEISDIKPRKNEIILSSTIQITEGLTPIINEQRIDQIYSHNDNKELNEIQNKQSGQDGNELQLFNQEKDHEINQDIRKMKSIDQVYILENEFKKNPNWSKDKIKQLSTIMRLKESQVYKWNWDRRNLREKYIEGRLKSMELPSQIFKVTRVMSRGQNEQTEIDITSKVGYFKILKQSNLNLHSMDEEEGFQQL